MTYSRIVGTGSYLPKKILTNAELEQQIDTSDSWIVDRTGIKQRHIAAEGETASSMASSAIQQALTNAGLKPSDVDLLIVGTCTPDRIFPSTACHIQKRLGIGPCPAFDVSAACAGFSYALTQADQAIRAGQAKCAVVVGVEIISRIVDWEDRGTCVLFGDGAGAIVLTRSKEAGIIASKISADGNHVDMLYAPNPLPGQKQLGELCQIQMQGREVFKFAVTKLGNLVETTLTEHGFDKQDLDWLVPHQANIRIIQAVAKRLDMSMDKVIVTVHKHSNTSSASIPLALAQGVSDGRIKQGDLILMESFGGGFTWGSTLIRF